MVLTNEEFNQFDKVVKDVLSPIIDECGDDIENILANNPELRSRIDEKVNEIMNKRNSKE